MNRPRRKLFGPLLYSTLVAGALASAFTGLMSVWPRVAAWREVRVLVEQMRGADPRAREGAAAALVRRGPEIAVPYLLEAARDPRGEVRGLALRSLVEAGADPSTLVPVLADAAGEGREALRLEAARSFGHMLGLEAMRARSSAGTLGRLTPGLRSECRTALGRLLKDPAGAVRAAAADAFGRFGPDPAVVAALAAATDDEDRRIRFAAAKALLDVHGADDSAATRTLVALVSDPGPVPDRRAILEVLQVTDRSVQEQAVTALAGLLAHGDPDVRPDVIDCLSAAGPRARAAVPALEALRDDEDPRLRAHAGLAIAVIAGASSPRAVAVLVGMVTDATLPHDARQAALDMLRQRNPAARAEATPGLIRQLGHVSPTVRRIASEMLSAIIEDTPAKMPASNGGK